MKKSNITWDETDFIEVLEVLPRHDDKNLLTTFLVEKDNLRLVLTVQQFEPEAHIELYSHSCEMPVFAVRFWYDTADRHTHGRHENLEFRGGRLPYLEADRAFTVRVIVNPTLSVRVVRDLPASYGNRIP